MSELADKPKILLEQDNVISLRTVFVLDDGDVVRFQLMPALLESSIPQTGRGKVDWAIQDCAWLYRHQRSEKEELALLHGFPCMQHDIRPMSFVAPPSLSAQWSDSGNGVAIFLNGEAWAFNDEETHKGYSKGMLKLGGHCCWDQRLFEKRFNL